ncbi:MAG: hypothetical protein IJG60_05585 [Thermoguttaceae bacterium]|nr:hypothetical protein [Thermoguttaceae bacterium]
MKRLFCVVFLVVFLNFTDRPFAEDLSPAETSVADEKLLADLETARKTWLESVSLYGHYSFREVLFFSEEEARSKEMEDDKIIAEGLLCKKQDKCRLQVLYNNPPYGSPEEGFLNRSSDYIVNRNYRILYHPSQGKAFASDGYLTKVETDDIFASIHDLYHLKTPFALFLEPDDFRSVTIDSEPLYADLGEGRAKILFSGKDQAGCKSTKEVIFRTNSSVPVIESIVMRFYLSNKTLISTITALDWKESNGLEIPTRIRSMVGPLRSANMDSDMWSVSEWKSEDLNSREPEDSDFVLKLDKGEKLAGMRYIPKNRLVDLDKITGSDFLESGEVDYDVYDDGSIPETALGLAWRIVLVLAGAGLILFSFFIRKRKRANSAGE